MLRFNDTFILKTCIKKIINIKFKKKIILYYIRKLLMGTTTESEGYR